jgi:alkylation response protein AidB-like acyl-CoA dehydrogenase
MDFDFSFEQRSLADGVRRVLQDFPPVTDRPPYAYRAADVIARLGDFGLFGTEGEASPLGHADLVAVMLEAGRTPAAAPIAETLAATMAFGAPVSEAIAAAGAKGCILGIAVSGTAATGAVVAHGGSAEAFLLPLDDGQWTLLASRDMTVSPVETMDITADAVRVRPRDGSALAPVATNGRLMAAVLQLACLAEIVGAAGSMLDRTVAYVAERRQFGKPVGSNQAVKHMAADCAVAVETMKAAVEYAGWAADEAMVDDAMAQEARLALLSAASFVGEHGRRVAERCVQMHGGIAFTWDYGLHVPLRRILFRTATLAQPRQAREGLAAHLLDGGD